MQNEIPYEIVRFIKKHHVLTLASRSDEGLWCSNMFYAWLADVNAFVFTSEEKTRHIRDILENPQVAASVVLETRTVGKVQGLQITGAMEKAEAAGEELLRKSRVAYLRRFPYAAVAPLDLWLLRCSFMKLTDNTLGFGKKIVWGTP